MNLTTCNILVILFALLLAVDGRYTESGGVLDIVSPQPYNCVYDEGATFIQMEVLNCTTQPCILNPRSTFELTPTFIPSWNTATLGYVAEFFPSSGEPKVSLANVWLVGTYQANTTYRIRYPVSIPSSMSLKSGHIFLHFNDASPRMHISRCFNVTVTDSFGINEFD